MSKKLQVFISSTFTDLIEDRQAAVEGILDAGHIPAGMELFRGGKPQMETIKKWIDESDVYMLILGGRYGSIEPSSGKSYTHLEYEYAVSKGIPLFAVVLDDDELDRRLRKSGKGVIEINEAKKYEEFKKLVKSNVCVFFNNSEKLKREIYRHLDEFSRNENLIGWIRSSEVIKNDIEIEYKKKIANLERKNRKLTVEIEKINEINLMNEVNIVKLKEDNLNLMITKQSKEDYAMLSSKINEFLNCTAVTKLSALWRRAAADPSDESSTIFLVDTAKVFEMINNAYNSITTSILDLDDKTLQSIHNCRDEAVGIINCINDLKMSAWHLETKYRKELELFIKGKVQNGPSKEAIFGNIAYDVNDVQYKLNKYNNIYWSLNDTLKEFLKHRKNNI